MAVEQDYAQENASEQENQPTEVTDTAAPLPEGQHEANAESPAALEQTTPEGEPAPEASPEMEKAEPLELPESAIESAVAQLDKLDPEDDSFWEAEDGYTAADRAKLEAMYNQTLGEFHAGEIVKGTVSSFDDREVVVNIGFKSEGIIPFAEFRDIDDLKPGAEVEVYIENVEDRLGQLNISRRKAQSFRTWQRILNAMEEDIVMEGSIKRRTKGGFVVDLEGIEAFLPGSQIDVKPIRDYDQYVGQRMEFKVVKINHQQHNVVISHKALIEKDLEQQKAEIINNLEKGQILEGTVKNITTFGVFVDLGGVDGLLHITDISWGRISTPEEVLGLDQKINVVVLDFDDEKKRISLGYKQLMPHPWDSLPEDFDAGARAMGRVVTIADYGIFVELADYPGVEGLVHVSEMSWSQQPKDPHELYNVGQEVETAVIGVDREERKLSLGIKQLTDDPWNKVGEKYPLDSVHKVVVRNITNYGLFVELEEGVDGLIHIQDLSWNKKFNHPSEFVEKDQELEAKVLEVDLENRKLRLGVKQLTEDPWETLESVFSIGSVHTGVITKLNDKGAVVELEYGIEGFAPSKQLKPEEGKDNLKEGESYPFMVLEFNKDAKRILLSHTRTWQNEPVEEETRTKKRKTKADLEQYSGAKAEKDTLGDLGELAALKARLEGGETDTDTPPAKKKTKTKKQVQAEEGAAETESKAEDSTEQAKTTAEEALPDLETTPETPAEEVAVAAAQAEEAEQEAAPETASEADSAAQPEAAQELSPAAEDTAEDKEDEQSDEAKTEE